MIRNYFKIAWRSVLRNKQSTFLNIAGLSTGLCCVLLIFLWVNDELSIDKFNKHDKRIYQVIQNVPTSTNILTLENTPGLLADALSKEMPEVAYAASVVPPDWFSNPGLFSFNDKNIRADVEFASKNYFKIFSFDFLAGDETGVTSDKNTILISDELAAKLFGTNKVIGRSVEWNAENFSGKYFISGVFKKFPSNSTVQFDAIFNYDLFLEKNPKLQSWGNSDPHTYVLLKQNTDAAEFNKKIYGFIKSKNEKSKSTLLSQRFSEKYLYNHYENGKVTGGRIQYVKLFSIIAIFILIIACINFMNLSTARALKRIKEVGVKKVMGARRFSLIIQYLAESLILSVLSLLLAIGLATAFLPVFKQITGKDLTLHFSSLSVFFLMGIAAITGIIAGSYPAFYLSKFKPVVVLKSKLKNSWGGLFVRKGLVTFQFVISLILIVAVLVVYQQMRLIQTINLGYDRDQVIYFEKGGKLSANNDDYKEGGPYEQGLKSFLQKIKSINGVVNAANFRHNITNREGGTTDVIWEGKAKGDQTQFTDISAGYDFIETLGIKMKQGRSYSETFGSEKSKVIFNEAAIKSMGLKDAIGKMVRIWGEEKQIVGVTEDFHFQPLYENIKPCFFDLSLNKRASKVIVKIAAGAEKATIDNLAHLYKAYTGETLNYKFLDEDYQALYASEKRVAVLSRYFAAMAIIISCLGLFGLIAFATQQRQKEIGIRKVIGASAGKIAVMLSKDFLQLVLIAIVIASPLAWLLLNNWLQNFAYRIPITLWIFIAAGGISILIAVATIGYQAIKAALANPVKSLRTE